jgi:hypothetical protein
MFLLFVAETLIVLFLRNSQSFLLDQVRLLILPNLDSYMQLLEPEMILEKQKNEIKRHEAWRVYGALLVSSYFNLKFAFYQVMTTWN